LEQKLETMRLYQAEVATPTRGTHAPGAAAWPPLPCGADHVKCFSHATCARATEPENRGGFLSLFAAALKLTHRRPTTASGSFGRSAGVRHRGVAGSLCERSSRLTRAPAGG